MKLLLCITCSDVRALRVGPWTRCRCRRSRARYRDEDLAEVSGEQAVLVGFANPSLIAALRRELADRRAGTRRTFGHVFEAFVIPAFSPNVRSLEPTRKKMS